MPVPHVDIQNGSVSNGSLTNGCDFKWSNPTTNWVTLSSCGGFCTQSTYNVPPASAGVNGTVEAQILASPTGYSFIDPAWNAPGQPRIVVNPEPTPMEVHREHRKEVA
jgi:hypothetical protein